MAPLDKLVSLESLERGVTLEDLAVMGPPDLVDLLDLADLVVNVDNLERLDNVEVMANLVHL